MVQKVFFPYPYDSTTGGINSSITNAGFFCPYYEVQDCWGERLRFYVCASVCLSGVALPLSGAGRYNEYMLQEHRHMPDVNRLSVLVAVILLAYALTHLVALTPFEVSLNFFGVIVAFPVNLNIVATLLVAGLTAAGTDWLLQGHPYGGEERSYQHWILPALTAFVIGVPLNNLPFGRLWWVSFGMGGIFLLLVLLAEYIVMDSFDVRYPAASAGLVALSYTLFLVLMSTLSFLVTRLIIVVLLVFFAAWLVSLRALHLRNGKWQIAWSVGIAIVLTQTAAALYYWPVEPVQYGLVLLGPLFVLTELAQNLEEEISLRRAGIEAVIGLMIFWVAALIL